MLLNQIASQIIDECMLVEFCCFVLYGPLYLVGFVGSLGIGAGGHLGETAEFALILSKRGCHCARAS
jgi:hypothetical protein